MEQASSKLNAIYKPIINDVEAPLQQGMSEQTMARFKAKQVVLTEGYRGQSNMEREATTPLMMLFSITGIVLLIACANIANLLLARGANRAMEMAVRLSLGASRLQLMGQLLTEAIMLAVIGGVASLLVAKWTVGVINSFLPSDAAGVFNFEMNGSMLVFAAVLSLGTGLVFGLFPALHSTRPDLITMIARIPARSVAPGPRCDSARRSSRADGTRDDAARYGGAVREEPDQRQPRRAGIKIDNLVTFGVSPELNGYTPRDRSRCSSSSRRNSARFPE
jgi:hypothetical protein